MNHHTKTLIIGSGAAGCTAAIYAARAMLEPVLVRGMQPGGQLTITADVENFPGFEHAVQGPWLMEQMEKQAAHVGTKILDDTIISVAGNIEWKPLVDSEKKFSGYGVSACATCDGFFFKNKEVVVIGGGNSAVEEALYLANIASKITLIHRRDSLRAEKIAQERLFKNPKITVIWDSVVEEFCGTENPNSLTHVRIKNVKTGTLSDIKCDGAFVSIGHKPNTEIFTGQLDMDAEHYLITTPGSTKTNIEGVFAAGDVQDKIYRQAVTAAGTGCMAALEAERWLAAHE